MRLRESLFFIALIVVVLLPLPIFSMFYNTLHSEQGFSLSLYSQIFDARLGQSFLNSLALALLVAFFTTIVGTLLAILFTKTSLPFSNFFLSIFITPLLIPPYILAFSWFELIGRDGVLGELLFGFWGTAFVLFWVYLPIPILLVSLFLTQIEPKLEESALLLSNWRGVLRQITIPLISPAIVLSSLLVFILTFGEFSVANFLRYPIFPMESFTQFSAFYDFKMATVTAMPMLLMALIIKWLIDKYTFNYRFKSSQKIKKIEINRYRFVILFILIGLAILVTLPLALLVVHTDIDNFLLAWERGFDRSR